MTTKTLAAGRLAAHPSHKIDHAVHFAFTFNGKSYVAYQGDTIASALWAAGERMMSRSFKYHRPRGPFALTSGDSNTIVRVDDEPNARASITPVVPGLEVKTQNTVGTLKTDLMSLTAFGDKFLPVGFYYKTFMYPKGMWPVYEQVLRKLAGLGHVTQEVPDAYYDKQYGHADVIVVGGGPAGMSAAMSAANAGARVILLDENPYLGDHLCQQSQMVEYHDGLLPAYELAKVLADQVTEHPNITVHLNTNTFGIYQDRWVGAQKGNRLFKLRAQSLVFANGAFEQPLLFHNNDIPGIILGSMARKLIHVYGVKPGESAVVLSANRDGLQTALDLSQAGVTVVVELRAEPDADLVEQLQQRGIAVRPGWLVTEAKGGQTLTSVTIAQSNLPSADSTGQMRPLKGTEQVVQCDLLVQSIGWMPATGLLYQAKAKMAYNEARGEFLPTTLPPRVHGAGRVMGTHNIATQLLEGELAGLNAAQDAGFGDGPLESLEAQVISRKAEEPVRSSKQVYVEGGKKSFISFDEDVTVKDLRDAIEEGYQSMELLKRYSTLSMGPSQGKYESLNTMALAAEANNQTILETGSTTSRPPFTSVPFGVFAGRMMEPIKYTAMHEWHVSHGATLMNAGLWKRPDHYGNPTAEVIGTRNAVGLIDVGTLGKLELRGPDVPKLLNLLYTNKWSKLKVGRTRYGIMCNEAGVIINDGVTARLADDLWYMTATTGGVNALYEDIQWNLQSGWNLQVHVQNMTDTYAAMNLTGPKAREVLQPLTEIDLSNEAFPYMSARVGLVAGVEARLLRIGFTGELGYELHVPASHGLYLWETLMQAGRKHAITPFGVEAQRVMRLEKGHFIVGQDTDGLTDPFMAHMDWSVKMDKADFVGKPALVRVQRRGVTHKLVGFTMLDPDFVPEEANQIVTPNPSKPIGLEIIGRVTSVRYSPTLKRTVGLCWLPIDRAEPDREFTLRVRGKLHIGKVVSLPFYDPEGERLKV